VGIYHHAAHILVQAVYGENFAACGLFEPFGQLVLRIYAHRLDAHH
jgi:hypothetical protein